MNDETTQPIEEQVEIVGFSDEPVAAPVEPIQDPQPQPQAPQEPRLTREEWEAQQQPAYREPVQEDPADDEYADLDWKQELEARAAKIAQQQFAPVIQMVAPLIQKSTTDDIVRMATGWGAPAEEVAAEAARKAAEIGLQWGSLPDVVKETVAKAVAFDAVQKANAKKPAAPVATAVPASGVRLQLADGVSEPELRNYLVAFGGMAPGGSVTEFLKANKNVREDLIAGGYLVKK